MEGEEVIYGKTHPTISKIFKERGFMAACQWVSQHLQYMFGMSKYPLEPHMLSELSRSVAVRYKHLMLTEFMHFCFLFRTGEFGKTFGRPDGATVFQALREYSAMRERILGNLRTSATPEPEPEGRKPHPMTPEIERMIADFFESESKRQGNWRGEPWGTAICRAYFVDHTLATFPGDMTYEERRQWANDNM